jgi:hypothetical protein
VWSADEARAIDIARRVRTGTIGVNYYNIDLGAPFGGMKDSGIGRELGPEGLNNYLDPPTFHVKAADRARVAYMPGTTWPVTGSPPDISWSLVLAPVLMPSKTNFDTSTAIRLRSPSRSPPDASCAPFPLAHDNGLQANAAVGGLTPLPEERRRRATTFIFHAAAQSIKVSYLHNDLSLARVAHTRSSSSRGAARVPGTRVSR